MIRLNKHLSALDIASRREADGLIAEGKISINGKIVTELGTKIDPEIDKITVNNKPVRDAHVHPHDRNAENGFMPNRIYIMLHKPVGYVCSAKATRQDPYTVVDLIDIDERVYPIGRLDKDTTGLILLTNDGTLVNQIIHPSSESEKEYEVTFEYPIPESSIARLESGVSLWGEKTLPTKVIRLGGRKIRIILREGKNRQIRRICQKVGSPVKTLVRVRIKNLWLGDLPLGRWRYLTEREVEGLKNS